MVKNKNSPQKPLYLDVLISKVAHFEPLESILFTDVYYTNLVKNRFMDCAQIASNKVKFLEKVEKWCEGHEGRLYREIVILAEEHFLKHIRLEAIESEEALCRISFKHVHHIRSPLIPCSLSCFVLPSE